ncbi:MAG: hypothetical protein Q7S66_02250 [bacterium]|nr:hypothetical protein [bacterium]
MRRNILDRVEIVEPPLEELTRKKSGFKHACAYGCLFLLLLIVGFTLFVRLFAGEGPQTLKKLPANFPKNIPIYDQENLENISFISGKYKSRSIEIAAVVPKIILSPLLLTLDKTNQTSTSSRGFTLQNLWKLVTTPITNSHDTIQIEWTNLDAEPSFIISYYKTELIKRGFTIDVESTAKGIKQFSFSHGDLSGSLYVKGDEEERPGTDYTELTVNFTP